MNKTKNEAPTQSNGIKKRLIYTFSFIAILIGLFYIIVALPLQQRFAVADKEMERVRSEIIDPSGGSEITRERTQFENEMPYFAGKNGFLGCPIDVSCPEIRRTWQVNIENGKEAEFIKAAMQKLEYEIESENFSGCSKLEDIYSCNIMSKKGNLRTSMILQKNTSTRIDNNQRSLDIEVVINYN